MTKRTKYMQERYCHKCSKELETAIQQKLSAIAEEVQNMKLRYQEHDHSPSEGVCYDCSAHDYNAALDKVLSILRK